MQTGEALGDLVTLSRSLDDIAGYTGRQEPSVIT